MKAKWLAVVFVALALGVVLMVGVVSAQGPASEQAMGTAFTYQGRLLQSDVEINGMCDMAFRLYDEAVSGSQVGLPISTSISVDDGLFTVALDFGSGAFDGEARWLQISVRCPAGTGSYATLTPRQALTPAPYALALPGLWTQENSTSPNLVGGYHGNSIASGIHGGTIGGGGDAVAVNELSANWTTIGGGFGNIASASEATIGGGSWNRASGGTATVGGGGANEAAGLAATVAGGAGNMATGERSSIAGGTTNEAGGLYASIGGGESNTAGSDRTTIGGGANNVASGSSSTVAGGFSNNATGYMSTVGGGDSNQAGGSAATVGGGYANVASETNSTVGGGGSNLADAVNATIGGGEYNMITSTGGTIGGGVYITVTGNWGTAAGGVQNEVSGNKATIGGGQKNIAGGELSTVGGGSENLASGLKSTVPGGAANVAQGDWSFAAGRRAKAYQDGCFVWGDSTDADVECNMPDRWVARADGGVYFYSSSDLSTGVYLANGSETWQQISASDRDLKENVILVDGRQVLANLLEMPISTWNYTAGDPAVRHMSPMAQDFYAAFGLGEDARHLSALDTTGVSLAAIQGLAQILQEKDAQIAGQQQQIEDLEARLAALEQAVAGSHPDQSSATGGWPQGLLLLGGLGVVAGVAMLRRQRGGEP